MEKFQILVRYFWIIICFSKSILAQYQIGHYAKTFHDPVRLDRQIETKIEHLSSKDSVTSLKEKLRNEIRNSLSKERYINEEDAKLLNAFIEKIQKDLNNN